MTHRCHAKECGLAVPPRLLMCARHWRMVRSDLKANVEAAYRPGQERDKKPSREYVKAMLQAVMFVADKEGKGSMIIPYLVMNAPPTVRKWSKQ